MGFRRRNPILGSSSFGARGMSRYGRGVSGYGRRVYRPLQPNPSAMGLARPLLHNPWGPASSRVLHRNPAPIAMAPMPQGGGNLVAPPMQMPKPAVVSRRAQRRKLRRHAAMKPG